ncbi:MAG: PAS domain-containing protein [Candidatus Bathyarchaeota archaeon]
MRIQENLPNLTQDIKLGLELWAKVQDDASLELRDFALESHIWFLKYLRDTNSKIPNIVIDDVSHELMSRNLVFETAIENAYCGILIINPHHEIIYANNAMTEIAGRSKNEMIGKSSDIFFSSREGYIEWIRTKLDEEGKIKQTTYTEQKPGKWLEIEAAKIIQGEEHVATVACVRDVSDRKNLELQVKELIDQLTSPKPS